MRRAGPVKRTLVSSPFEPRLGGINQEGVAGLAPSAVWTVEPLPAASHFILWYAFGPGSFRLPDPKALFGPWRTVGTRMLSSGFL